MIPKTGQIGLILLVVLQSSFYVRSQHVELVHYRKQDKVLLRWAIDDAALWLEYVNNGFTLERYTLTKDSYRLYPTKRDYVVSDIMPLKLHNWEQAYSESKYAAIAAQALYGDSFSVEFDATAGGPYEAIMTSQELNARFSFLMLSCEQSYKVAKMAGLAFEDSNVLPDEAYLYKLYLTGGMTSSDTTHLFVPSNNSSPLPEINSLTAKFTEQSVELKWESSIYDNIYSSYIVEESRNGQTFYPSDSLTSIQTTRASQASQFFSRIINLADNQKYYYRIKGKNSFGMIGPPSNIVEGKSFRGRLANLSLTQRSVSDSHVSFELNIESENTNKQIEVDSTILYRSSEDRVYEPILCKAGLIVNLNDAEPKESAYYKARIEFTSGEFIETLPILVQMPDSIPPVPPKGLVGYCDSLGNVHLSWQLNQEKDIKGYRVFRSRVARGDYRQITSGCIIDSAFVDSIGIRNSSSKIYYRIQAQDNRLNNSLLSRNIEIVTTDTVSPVPPRILDYERLNGFTRINFIPSTSIDNYKTVIYRQTEKFVDTLSFQLKNGESRQLFIDSTENFGKVKYGMQAIDRHGNSSDLSNIIQLSATKDLSERFEIVAESNRQKHYIKLGWEYDPNFGKIIIYRGVEEDELRTIKVIDSVTNKYYDYDISPGSQYFYLIQVFVEKRRKIISSKTVRLNF